MRMEAVAMTAAAVVAPVTPVHRPRTAERVDVPPAATAAAIETRAAIVALGNACSTVLAAVPPAPGPGRSTTRAATTAAVTATAPALATGRTACQPRSRRRRHPTPIVAATPTITAPVTVSSRATIRKAAATSGGRLSVACR